jgi:hypothetical protein
MSLGRLHIPQATSGGGLEYLHRIAASRRRRRNGNPVPGGITGSLCSWGIYIRGHGPPGWGLGVKKITLAKSKVVETGWSTSRRNRQVWQNILRKAMAQTGLFWQLLLLLLLLLLSRILLTCRRGLDWWIDLLDAHKSQVKVIITL